MCKTSTVWSQSLDSPLPHLGSNPNVHQNCRDERKRGVDSWNRIAWAVPTPPRCRSVCGVEEPRECILGASSHVALGQGERLRVPGTRAGARGTLLGTETPSVPTGCKLTVRTRVCPLLYANCSSSEEVTCAVGVGVGSGRWPCVDVGAVVPRPERGPPRACLTPAGLQPAHHGGLASPASVRTSPPAFGVFVASP